jgi:phosphoglycerate kinase
MHIPVIHELPLQSLRGARALVRVAGGDDLAECQPTFEYLAGAGSRMIVAGDFGEDAAGRLAREFGRLLGREARTLPPGCDIETLQRVMTSDPEEVIVAPDLRRSPGETANDPDFARCLASLADIYCDDAFPLAHLALASTVGIVRFVGCPVAGLGMARVAGQIEALIDDRMPRSLAIVGGTGLELKAPLLFRLCDLVTHLFVGGALCFPFMRAKGIETGEAPVDDDLVPVAKEILEWAKGRTELIFPTDFVSVHRASEAFETVGANELADQLPMDIGGRTSRQLMELLSEARVLFWNGPVGVSEIESFAGGTRELARTAAARAAQGLRGVIWGDSLARALEELNESAAPLRAMIAPSAPATRMISGLPLPGLEALRRHSKPHPKRVVLPVDDSDIASELVLRAAPLLEGTNSEIHLLFVRRPSNNGHDADKFRLEADRVFDRATAQLALFRIAPVAQAVKEGDTEDCVLEYAGEVGADLLAIASLDLPAPLRALAGDWSRAIEKRATIPLLLVQVPDE